MDETGFRLNSGQSPAQNGGAARSLNREAAECRAEFERSFTAALRDLNAFECAMCRNLLNRLMNHKGERKFIYFRAD